MGTKDTSLRWPAASRGNYDFSPGGGQGYTNQATTVQTVVIARTRTGVSMPNWREKIAKGENATTPLTARWDAGTSTYGSCMLKFYGLQWQPLAYAGHSHVTLGNLQRTGDTTLNARLPLSAATDPTYADNMARAKFYKALRRMEVQWSAPTFLGELGESLRMLRRPANALFRGSLGYLSALERARRGNPRYWARTAGDLWLEYSFGWVPLINDTKEAYDAYRSLVNGGTKKTVLSKGFSHEVDASSTLSAADRGVTYKAFQTPFHYWYCNNAKRNERIVVRYKAKIEETVEATELPSRAIFGFVPNEFVPTAWELLPWSFLIDYFTNVGDILNAWVTDSKRVAFVNKSVVKYCHYTGSLMIDAARSASQKDIYTTRADVSEYVEPTWDWNRKDVTRSAVSGVPLPTLQHNFSLGNGQLANIAALLTKGISLHPQQFRKPYR